MLHSLQMEPLVRAALLEDLGRAGDITSQAIIPITLHANAALVSRQPGTVAGLPFAQLAFELIDPSIHVAIKIPDAAKIFPGETIATIEGPAQSLLTAERVALNFLGHLSGIATVTAGIARAIAHTKAKITCTRKTTPNLRAAEKYAVRCGGGQNHRFGLDDAIMIKDNHIAIAGGIEEALRRAKAHAGHLVKIEIEVDTLAQLEEVLRHGADAILLDNMPPAMLRDAVEMVNSRAITEASGRITPETASAIAETGVDLLSAGWLTHSAPVLDIGLDIDG